MSDPIWYRSLYWRIGLGFIVCVTGLLVAQGLLFLWLTGHGGGPLGSQSPQRLVELVASDISAALDTDPQLDIEEYVREQFGRVRQPFLVVLVDGRLVQNRAFALPPRLVRSARVALRHSRAFEHLRHLRRLHGPARIVSRDTVVGVVVPIFHGRPFVFAIREYGPELAAAAVALLFAGTTGMAFFVFRPARRRLRVLERATAAIGAGDTSVRAPERGGDEVALLARAFNRMAADLEARARELQASDRARRQLLADVSHELMTPLTAIRGYLETLAMPEAAQAPAARQRYLEIVTDETLRLESIIGDLLDLARLEGGGVALEREPVPVDWLFGRIRERHGTVLQEKRITLDVQIAPGADAVNGDARRLEQAVQNLAANAVRHAPVDGRVTLSAEPIDGHVRLMVRDTGPGIPAEHLPLIFDRFYKVDMARDHGSSGSGLGLSIVKAIVDGHGGTITASSPPEGGALFEVVLDKASTVEPGGGGSSSRDR